jgi:hypothetical protein
MSTFELTSTPFDLLVEKLPQGEAYPTVKFDNGDTTDAGPDLESAGPVSAERSPSPSLVSTRSRSQLRICGDARRPCGCPRRLDDSKIGDIRRDRPVRGSQRLTTLDAESVYSCGFSGSSRVDSAWLREVDFQPFAARLLPAGLHVPPSVLGSCSPGSTRAGCGSLWAARAARPLSLGTRDCAPRARVRSTLLAQRPRARAFSGSPVRAIPKRVDSEAPFRRCPRRS